MEENKREDIDGLGGSGKVSLTVAFKLRPGAGRKEGQHGWSEQLYKGSEVGTESL